MSAQRACPGCGGPLRRIDPHHGRRLYCDACAREVSARPEGHDRGCTRCGEEMRPDPSVDPEGGLRCPGCGWVAVERGGLDG